MEKPLLATIIDAVANKQTFNSHLIYNVVAKELFILTNMASAQFLSLAASLVDFAAIMSL